MKTVFEENIKIAKWYFLGITSYGAVNESKAQRIA